MLNLRGEYPVALAAEGIDQALGVVYAAELTDNVNDCLADLEVGLYAVMLERDDVRVLLCNDMREALECAR